MVATVEFIEDRYRKFNSLIFEDALPEVRIALSRSARCPGQLCFMRRRRMLREDSISDICLKISRLYDLDEAELEDIIIHEMIHCRILTGGIRDTSAHGREFRRIMAGINGKFGRHVSISYRTGTSGRPACAPVMKTRTVAIVTLRDGRTGIKVLPAKAESAARYAAGMRRSTNVAGLELIRSDDPFFARFPSSSALRVYLLDEAEIREHLGQSNTGTI